VQKVYTSDVCARLYYKLLSYFMHTRIRQQQRQMNCSKHKRLNRHLFVKTKPRLNKQHENCPMKAKSIDFKLRYIILTSKHISFIQSLIRFERIIILQIQYIQITQTHAHTHTANRQAARPTQSTTKPLKTMCVTSHDAKQTRNIRIQCRHYAAVYRKLQTANRHTG